MYRNSLSFAGAVCLFVLYFSSSYAADVSFADASQICQNWINNIAAIDSWAGSESPSIASSEVIFEEDLRIGYKFDIEPTGYVVIPAITELAPIKSWSKVGLFQDGGFSQYVINNLSQRVQLAQTLTQSQLLDAFPQAELNRQIHSKYIRNDFSYERVDIEQIGPLVQTSWHQDYPFNQLCPDGDGGKTYVGCTPLAAAQLVKYHQWPISGSGNEHWWWDGDSGCNSSSPGADIYADYSNPFSYHNMPNTVLWDSTQEVKGSVAELCFEMSSACHTQYSRCGSGASLSDAKTALVDRFKFQNSAQELSRFWYPQEEMWFDIIQQELDSSRPILYSSLVHTMVCDGYLICDQLKQIHLNYGWGGDSDNWFSLDNIETSYYDMTERMLVGISPEVNGEMPLVSNFRAIRNNRNIEISWSIPSIWIDSEFELYRSYGNGSFLLENSPPSLRGNTYSVFAANNGSSDSKWLLRYYDSIGNQWEYGPIQENQKIQIHFLSGSVKTFSGNTPQILFNALKQCDAEFSIFDIKGRLVHKEIIRVEEGDNMLSWSGKNRKGLVMSEGIYLAKISSAKNSISAKLILVR